MTITFFYLWMSKRFQRFVAGLTLAVFCVSSISPFVGTSQAQATVFQPSSMSIQPALIKGLRLIADKPFEFEFIISDRHSETRRRDEESQSEILPVTRQDDVNNSEYLKLIKYFLAALTIPEQDLWVNLNPNEPDRIIPQVFGQTDMGKDLLAQDYVLKQLSASLLSPENETGKKFWERVYEKVYEKVSAVRDQGSGFPDSRFLIPDALNSLNKVWIVPSDIQVFENGDRVFITRATLKVMMEGDYFTEVTSNEKRETGTKENLIRSPLHVPRSQDDVKQIIRSTILPIIEQEVNEGESFAPLRQIYHSLILATWYKRKLKDSILNKIYSDKNKVSGISYQESEFRSQDSGIRDKGEGAASSAVSLTPEQIYQNYLVAFKSGVSNVIREEYDPQTQTIVPRHYITGGAELTLRKPFDQAQLLPAFDNASLSVVHAGLKNLSSVEKDDAMLSLNSFDAQSADELYNINQKTWNHFTDNKDKFSASYGQARAMSETEIDQWTEKLQEELSDDLIQWDESWESRYAKNFYFSVENQRYERVDGKISGVPNFVRIGHVFFIDAKHYLSLSDDLRTGLGSNAVVIPNIMSSDLTQNAFSRNMLFYASSAMFLMLHENIGQHEGFIDVGSGEGLLSIFAYKLGVKKLFMIEKDQKAISKMNMMMVFNGLQPSDYVATKMDITNQNDREAFAKDVLAKNITSFSAAVNIGYWLELYGSVSNQDALQLQKLVSNIQKWILAGYEMGYDTDNLRYIYQDLNILESFGLKYSQRLTVGGSQQVLAFSAVNNAAMLADHSRGGDFVQTPEFEKLIKDYKLTPENIRRIQMTWEPGYFINSLQMHLSFISLEKNYNFKHWFGNYEDFQEREQELLKETEPSSELPGFAMDYKGRLQHRSHAYDKKGRAVFVEISGIVFFDLERFLELSDDDAKMIASNVILVPKLHETELIRKADQFDKGAQYYYATAMMFHMAREHIDQSRGWIDLGSGQGWLSLFAWKLGVEFSHMVEKDGKMIAYSRDVMTLNGRKDQEDYQIHQVDLTDQHQVERLIESLKSFQEKRPMKWTVGINIGTWPQQVYGSVRNIVAIPIIKALRNVVRLFFAGGYDFGDPIKNKKIVEKDQKEWKEQIPNFMARETHIGIRSKDSQSPLILSWSVRPVEEFSRGERAFRVAPIPSSGVSHAYFWERLDLDSAMMSEEEFDRRIDKLYQGMMLNKSYQRILAHINLSGLKDRFYKLLTAEHHHINIRGVSELPDQAEQESLNLTSDEITQLFDFWLNFGDSIDVKKFNFKNNKFEGVLKSIDDFNVFGFHLRKEMQGRIYLGANRQDVGKFLSLIKSFYEDKDLLSGDDQAYQFKFLYGLMTRYWFQYVLLPFLLDKGFEEVSIINMKNSSELFKEFGFVPDEEDGVYLVKNLHEWAREAGISDDQAMMSRTNALRIIAILLAILIYKNSQDRQSVIIDEDSQLKIEWFLKRPIKTSDTVMVSKKETLISASLFSKFLEKGQMSISQRDTIQRLQKEAVQSWGQREKTFPLWVIVQQTIKDESKENKEASVSYKIEISGRYWMSWSFVIDGDGKVISSQKKERPFEEVLPSHLKRWETEIEAAGTTLREVDRALEHDFDDYLKEAEVVFLRNYKGNQNKTDEWIQHQQILKDVFKKEKDRFLRSEPSVPQIILRVNFSSDGQPNIMISEMNDDYLSMSDKGGIDLTADGSDALSGQLDSAMMTDASRQNIIQHLSKIMPESFSMSASDLVEKFGTYWTTWQDWEFALSMMGPHFWNLDRHDFIEYVLKRLSSKNLSLQKSMGVVGELLHFSDDRAFMAKGMIFEKRFPNPNIWDLFIDLSTSSRHALTHRQYELFFGVLTHFYIDLKNRKNLKDLDAGAIAKIQDSLLSDQVIQWLPKLFNSIEELALSENVDFYDLHDVTQDLKANRNLSLLDIVKVVNDYGKSVDEEEYIDYQDFYPMTDKAKDYEEKLLFLEGFNFSQGQDDDQEYWNMSLKYHSKLWLALQSRWQQKDMTDLLLHTTAFKVRDNIVYVDMFQQWLRMSGQFPQDLRDEFGDLEQKAMTAFLKYCDLKHYDDVRFQLPEKLFVLSANDISASVISRLVRLYQANDFKLVREEDGLFWVKGLSNNAAMLTVIILQRFVQKQMGAFDKGGIDLTADGLNIQASGHLDPAMMELPKGFDLKNFKGFVPVIYSIQPVTDLPMLLGVKPNSADPQRQAHKNDVWERMVFTREETFLKS